MSRERRRQDLIKAAHDDYVVSEQVGYLLRRAYQRHLAIFQAHSCDPQLTSTQFSTLCQLRDAGPQSQAELVRGTGIDQATIRGIVDRLRSRELVQLEKDRQDARKIIIEITKTGLSLVETMIPRARAITELTFNGLNPAERVALLYTLNQIIGPIDDQ